MVQVMRVTVEYLCFHQERSRGRQLTVTSAVVQTAATKHLLFGCGPTRINRCMRTVGHADPRPTR